MPRLTAELYELNDAQLWREKGVPGEVWEVRNAMKQLAIDWFGVGDGITFARTSFGFPDNATSLFFHFRTDVPQGMFLRTLAINEVDGDYPGLYCELFPGSFGLENGSDLGQRRMMAEAIRRSLQDVGWYHSRGDELIEILSQSEKLAEIGVRVGELIYTNDQLTHVFQVQWGNKTEVVKTIADPWGMENVSANAVVLTAGMYELAGKLSRCTYPTTITDSETGEKFRINTSEVTVALSRYTTDFLSVYGMCEVGRFGAKLPDIDLRTPAILVSTEKIEAVVTWDGPKMRVALLDPVTIDYANVCWGAFTEQVKTVLETVKGVNMRNNLRLRQIG